MFESVDRKRARQLIDEGAQVVEVLEENQFRMAHLPGAVHLPAWDLTREGAGALDPRRPVIVYCFDNL